jgi:hypothetical protein
VEEEAEEADVAEVEAAVDARVVEELRGPEEGFRPQPVPHVLQLPGPARGRAPAVARRLPLDRRDPVEQAHQVALGLVAAHRAEAPQLDSFPHEVVDRRTSLAGAVERRPDSEPGRAQEQQTSLPAAVHRLGS